MVASPVTNADTILAAITSNPGLTDAELRRRTGIEPHQQVNQICHRLVSQRLVETRSEAPMVRSANFGGLRSDVDASQPTATRRSTARSADAVTPQHQGAQRDRQPVPCSFPRPRTAL